MSWSTLTLSMQTTWSPGPHSQIKVASLRLYALSEDLANQSQSRAVPNSTTCSPKAQHRHSGTPVCKTKMTKRKILAKLLVRCSCESPGTQTTLKLERSRIRPVSSRNSWRPEASCGLDENDESIWVNERGFVKPTVVAAAQWPPLLPFNFTILISLKTFQFKVE